MKKLIAAIILCAGVAQAQDISAASEQELTQELRNRDQQVIDLWISANTTALAAAVGAGQVVVLAAGSNVSTPSAKFWFNISGATTTERKHKLALAKMTLKGRQYAPVTDLGNDTLLVTLPDAKRWAEDVDQALLEAIE